MRDSVIWGVIVGIALGVVVTFALARGVLPLPWQSAGDERQSPVGTAIQQWHGVELETRTSSLPTRSTEGVEPRRPARPGSLVDDSPASVASSHRSLSRS